MVRVLTGLAAWAGGTALAVSLAWFGANVVVRNAGVTPDMPVVSAVTPTPPVSAPDASSGTASPATASSGIASPATASPRAPVPAVTVPGAASATTSASPAASPDTPATATPATATPATATPGTGTSGTGTSGTGTPPATAGSAHSYTLTGGRVTLLVTPSSVELLTAVPDPGYSVQTWSGTDWLRVDFSSGPQVSSLIASWYEHTPSITTTN